MRNLVTLMNDWFSAFRRGGAPGRGAPTASGEYDAARARMVAEQLTGERRGISNAAILAAMAKVPRHEFVPVRLRGEAYEDHPVPIGHGQTVSQPYIVAFMTQQLDPKPSERILEIGTGSGYQTAILAELAGEIFTIEMIRDLAERAGAALRRLGYANVRQRCGDGARGWPDAAPFDAVIGTCAPDHVPQPLVDQLAEGGRMVIPVGASGRQQVCVLRKHGSRIENHAILPVQFVPMVGSVSAARD
jgi:protein-L-isoaspartate(D-aspartate) O-methyltransferase